MVNYTIIFSILLKVLFNFQKHFAFKYFCISYSCAVIDKIQKFIQINVKEFVFMENLDEDYLNQNNYFS